MELRHLRYFLAVAKERHFTRAAERLGIKQPPLSMQIRQLEDELGTPLFHRLTRGVELTEAGEVLFEQAERLLQQVDQLKADVQSRARGETGLIRIGFAGATYFHPLIPALAMAFRERYPEVVLSSEASNTPRLSAALRAGEIDVAFVRPPVSDAEHLRVDPLVEEPMLVVVPQSSPLAREGAVALDALARSGRGSTTASSPGASAPASARKSDRKRRRSPRSSTWWRRGSASRSFPNRSPRSTPRGCATCRSRASRCSRRSRWRTAGTNAPSRCATSWRSRAPRPRPRPHRR
jgi:DNA-binding transcriptional LysR family regulator